MSESVTITYKVDCTPSIAIPPDEVIHRKGVHLALPYSVFAASTYSKNNIFNNPISFNINII